MCVSRARRHGRIHIQGRRARGDDGGKEAVAGNGRRGRGSDRCGNPREGGTVATMTGREPENHLPDAGRPESTDIDRSDELDHGDEPLRLADADGMPAVTLLPPGTTEGDR